MSKKIGCLFINITSDEYNNYQKDDFFNPNAINSFKKWHPDVDIHYVNNSNVDKYLSDLVNLLIYL